MTLLHTAASLYLLSFLFWFLIIRLVSMSSYILHIYWKSIWQIKPLKSYPWPNLREDCDISIQSEITFKVTYITPSTPAFGRFILYMVRMKRHFPLLISLVVLLFFITYLWDFQSIHSKSSEGNYSPHTRKCIYQCLYLHRSAGKTGLVCILTFF